MTGTTVYVVVTRAWPGIPLGPLLGVSSLGFPMPLEFAKLSSPAVATLLATHLPHLLLTAGVIALIGSMDALLSAVAVDARHAKRPGIRVEPALRSRFATHEVEAK